MFDSGFPPPDRPAGHLLPEAGASPACPAELRPGSPSLAPVAAGPGVALTAATRLPDACAGAPPAPAGPDAGLAHRAALRRQLLALLEDEPTGHPLSPKLP